MTASKKRGVGRFGRVFAIGVAILLGLYFILTLLVFPTFAKRQIISLVESQTGIAPSLEAARFDPVRMRVRLLGFELPAAPREPEASPSVESETPRPALLAFDSLILDLRPSGFLTADVALDEVVLTGPRVSVERAADGSLDWLELFAGEEADGAENEEPSELLIVDIDAIRIERGTLRFRDLGFDSAFDVTLEPLSLLVSDFTTRSNLTSTYDLDFKIGDRTKVAWTGGLSLAPIASSGTISIENFDLQVPRAYLAPWVTAEIQQGFATFRSPYTLEMPESGAGLQLDVHDAELELAEVVIVDRNAAPDASELLALSSFRIDGIQSEVRDGALRLLEIAEVVAPKGKVAVRIDSKSRLQWVEATSSPPASGEASTAVVSPTAEKDVPPEVVSESERQSEAVTADGGAEVAPEIRIARIAISEFEIAFSDASRREPVELTFAATKLEVDGFDSRPGQKLDLTFETSLAPEGRLVVAGPISIEPFGAALDVEATSLPIAAFKPYLAEVAAVDVPSGRAAAELQIILETNPGGETRVQVTGDGAIQDLEVLDPKRKESVLSWKSVTFKGLDSAGGDLTLEELSIGDAALRISLDRDGRTNFAELLAGASPDTSAQSAGKTASAGPRSPPPSSDSLFRINHIQVERFAARFTDASVDPPFGTRLSELTGTIDGLSSEAGSLATLRFDGKVDESAPLSVRGKLNPLRSDASTEVSVMLDGVAMPILSPYSGRYVGYGIERGKLNVRLDYEIEGRELKAKNHFTLERLRFGSKSKDAKKIGLPVPLAMAVMRDSKGKVQIDLPIQGNLDDPSFNILQLLGKTFVSLVTRVATAPFSILGGVVGMAMEDLSSVNFAPGSVELDSVELAELEKLSAAMADRPTLRLDIRGRADPAIDGAALGEVAAAYGAEEWEEFARARALAVQAALTRGGELSGEGVYIVGVEVGDFTVEGGVTTEIEMGAR